MSKLDQVLGVQSNNEYNEGFNAGINFVKTVIESNEFNNQFSDALLKKGSVDANKFNQIIINVLKGYNL